MPERTGRSGSQKIRDTMRAMALDWRAVADARLTIERFNGRIETQTQRIWAWPTIAAALITKFNWLVIACDSCGTIIDMDLSMKPRDPHASIYDALADVRCPRCNGHGRTRIMRLARFPSIQRRSRTI
jgi:hypothetical protein